MTNQKMLDMVNKTREFAINEKQYVYAVCRINLFGRVFTSLEKAVAMVQQYSSNIVIKDPDPKTHPDNWLKTLEVNGQYWGSITKLEIE